MSQANPWEYLEAIPRHQVLPEQRHMFYQPFIALVAQRNEAERDALLEAGRNVFHYRTETARRDVLALRETGAGVTKISPTVIGDDFIAEIIHHPGNPTPIRYAVYHDATGNVEIADRVQIGDVIYMPPQTSLVETGALLLPTGVEEYDDEASLRGALWHFIQAHVHFEKNAFKDLSTYYVMLTWIFDRFDVVPYLRAIGNFGTGKTRMLEVIGHVAYRPIFAGGATTAAPIFRILHRFPGTLVIDEADFGKSDLWDDIVKILNIGYQRTFPILRAERGGRNDNFEVQSFTCYSPKLLASRRRFSDQALESRCLSYIMRSTSVPRHIPLFTGPDFRQRALSLRNKLLLWRFRNYRRVTADPRQRFDGFDARMNQILIPLMSCIDDPEMRASLLEHARGYQAALHTEKLESWDGRVATALLNAYRSARQTVKQAAESGVQLKSIVERLEAERPDRKVDARSVSRTVRDQFALHTKMRGGYAWVIMSDGDAERIASEYRIAFEPFAKTPAAGSFNPPRIQESARRQPVTGETP